MVSIMRVRAASTGWPGAPGLNTFYFVAHGGPDPAEPVLDDAQLCADRVHAAFAAGDDLWPTTWSCTVSPDVDVLDAETGELIGAFSVDPPAAIPGVNGTAFGPTAAALLVQLRTNTFDDGSRIQGRAFLGPVVPAADANGSPNAGIIAVAVAFGVALDDAGVSEEPVLSVWRRPRAADPDHLPEPITARVGSTADVTSLTVPDKYAVLRSRRD